MPALSVVDWLLLVTGAVFVGFAKSAIGTAAALSAALFAVVLPARESTGALLPLLLTGDLVAVTLYRAHAEWRRLGRLLPAVLVGVLAGAAFVGHVDDTVMRRTIGAVLLALALVAVLRRRGRAAPGDLAMPAGRLLTSGYGALAGFTTMVANAGGPVMSLYLLGARLEKLSFLGTTAWFFFGVNLVKLPFSVGLGLVTAQGLRLDGALAGFVLAGAWAGRQVIGRLDQRRFESVVLALTVVASALLIR